MRVEGGKVFIVEEGAHPIVVLSFEEYERLMGGTATRKGGAGDPDAFTAAFDAEYRNQRRSEIESQLAGSPPHSVSSDHIRLEDLPL